MRAAIVLTVLAVCSCETPRPRSAPDSVEGEFLHRRLGVNVWDDERVAFLRTRTRYNDSIEEGRPLAVEAAPWSYGGVAARLVSPIGMDTLYQPEIHVAATTVSGVRLRVFVDGTELKRSGYYMTEWHRFPITAATFEKGLASGASVRVECEALAQSWTFPLVPAYFLGFDKRIAEVVRVERLARSPNHKPVESTEQKPSTTD